LGVDVDPREVCTSNCQLRAALAVQARLADGLGEVHELIALHEGRVDLEDRLVGLGAVLRGDLAGGLSDAGDLVGV
jgi:hypothetical protein